jgi:uncharacterized protein (TIGR02147 family)
MNKNIFDFQDYKAYLRERIASEPQKGRGLRSKLATFLRAQPAFVSQVLEGEAHFNLEHAEKVGRFFSCSEEETHFLVLLVSFARAGSAELRQYFFRQMQVVIAKRLEIKNRIDSEQPLNVEEQVRYYSAWYFGAIRVAVTIPRLQNRGALADYFRLPPLQIKEAVDFLITHGLLQESNGALSTTKKHVHLGHDSALIGKFHANWRLQVLANLDRMNPHDIHFSSALSMSGEDQQKLQAMIVDFIAGIQKRVQDSREEKLCSFCLDFFEI